MRISDWSSDVCSSDLVDVVFARLAGGFLRGLEQRADVDVEADVGEGGGDHLGAAIVAVLAQLHHQHARAAALLALESLDLALDAAEALRSEEHTSELQSLMRISYAVFCLQKKHEN